MTSGSIIYRLPNNKSIIKPRSKCNGCGKQIAWYDNIPVLSYIALLAKCRNCKSPISIRYPLVEFICGMMALMLLNIYGPSYEFLVVVLLCFMLIAITFIDVDHFVIPNEFIIFGFIISIISHTFNLLPISIIDGIYGFLTFGGTLFIMGAMGTFIGTIYAWILVRTNAPGKKFLRILAIIPLTMPALVKSIGWVAILSPSIGIINTFSKMSWGGGFCSIYIHSKVVYL